MIKQRQFSVIKLKSTRLKEAKYNISTITASDARKHNELIELGDNQILELIRRVKGTDVDFNKLDELIEERDNLKLEKSSIETRKRIDELQHKIDEIIFIPEYISVKIENDSHYDSMKKKGFRVNNKKYIRISCSASQARLDTVIFVEEEIHKKIYKILCNGINFDEEIVPSKFNAYFGLYSTSRYKVTEPKVCVIKDCETQIYRPIDFITEYDDGDVIEERDDVPIGLNYWDGMGIIAPRMARQWAKDLQISYLPSNFIIRNSWVKGMVCTFDFHKFSREIARNNIIKDIYGVEYNINDIDIILTESQFKLNKFYKSWQEWLENTRRNELSWGVSRVSPQVDSEYMFANYQFIQTLNISEDEIKELTKPTLDWLYGIVNNIELYSTLFLSGGFRSEEAAIKSIKESDNPQLQAIMYNPELIKDGYIQKKIYEYIRKKVRKAMIGKILLRGNFQMMIADPYALCEHAFGMEIKGLLKEGQHYSNFWNERNVKEVDAMRSPLTDKSEHNILNLQNTEKMREWYKYINTGIIFNIFGLDCVKHADSDFDGDIVATTDNKYFLKGVVRDALPITYQKKTAQKAKINSDNLFLADKQAFHSTIGTITNHSTSMYALLPLFDRDSDEYKEIQRRLKILRKEQGSAIDKAKGILTKPFPNHWVEYTKLNIDSNRDDLTKEEIELIKKVEFNNRIVADKKPYFFYHLYNNCRKNYNKFKNELNTYCRINFGITVDEVILKENKTKDELEFCKLYNKRNPLNESDCVMNMLCRHIERFNEEKLKKFYKNNKEYLLDKMMNKNYKIKKSMLKKIENLYLEYCADKKSKIFDSMDEREKEESAYNGFSNLAEYYLNRALRICSDEKELANYAVEIEYNKYNKSTKDFTWKVCKNGLLQNIKENSGNKIIVPILDVDGDIEYLGSKYKRKEISL